MAQADYIVSNGTGAAVRSDLNGQLAAIVTNNSGATAPATTYAYQWWADTTTNTLKLRNSANSAWIEIMQLDGTLTMEDGTAALPGLAFRDDLDTGIFRAGTNQFAITTGGTARVTTSTTAVTSALPVDVLLGSASTPSYTFTGDLNTGIFSPGADQVAISTNSVERLKIGTSEVVFNDAGNDIDFRVEGDTNADLFKIDAGTDTVIVGGKYNILKGFNRRPPLHRGPLFTKTTATTLSVVADCSLNGFFYSSATAVTMGTHTNNTDMAIWQHPTSGALVSDASFTTAPAGAAGGSIVGGYHYIPSGRPTAVNSGSPTSAAEILEYSIWDLTWRPECPDPRGMANIDGRFWCDLYLCGSTSFAGTDFSAVPSSRIGLTIADDSSPPKIPSFYGGNGSTAYTLIGGNNPGSWYNFFEVAHSFGKRLMFSWEFQAAAFGAPEAGSRGSDPGTVQWERQSKWGLAQATGTLFIWGIERVGIYTSGFNTNTGGRGTEYADAPRAVLLGGGFSVGADSGSRAAYWSVVPSSSSNLISARFACDHLICG